MWGGIRYVHVMDIKFQFFYYYYPWFWLIFVYNCFLYQFLYTLIYLMELSFSFFCCHCPWSVPKLSLPRIKVCARAWLTGGMAVIKLILASKFFYIENSLKKKKYGFLSFSMTLTFRILTLILVTGSVGSVSILDIVFWFLFVCTLYYNIFVFFVSELLYYNIFVFFCKQHEFFYVFRCFVSSYIGCFQIWLLCQCLPWL